MEKLTMTIALATLIASPIFVTPADAVTAALLAALTTAGITTAMRWAFAHPTRPGSARCREGQQSDVAAFGAAKSESPLDGWHRTRPRTSMRTTPSAIVLPDVAYRDAMSVEKRCG
jgi:hypothetical protein